MFELEILNNSEKNSVEIFSFFKKVIESLLEIVEQMELKISPDGLKIQVMDSMHVCLADIFLSSKLFSSYRCDRDLQMGIPLKTFFNILKTINLNSDSVFKLSSDDNPESINIFYKSKNYNFNSDLTLYQINSENYDLPNLEFSSIIKLTTERFKSITKSVGQFGEFISFSINKDDFIVRQQGEICKTSLKISNDQENSTSINSTENVNLEIAMKYVNLINKISPVSDEIKISMHPSSPVFFELKTPEFWHIQFYVAPKMI